MVPRITLIKSYRNKETLRLLELQEVAELISQGEYDTEVSMFRRDLPTMRYARVSNNGTLEGYENWPKDLPRICFALEQENRNHELVTLGYTGFVLLEVNNLTSYDEAVAIRRGAGEMPQTLMAFVGADGLSVKIICRGELLEESGTRKVERDNSAADFPLLSRRGQGWSDPPQNNSPSSFLRPFGSKRPLAERLFPPSSELIPLFHENLYERSRLIYNGQLGVTIEKLEPLTQRICYMSFDPPLVYNP